MIEVLGVLAAILLFTYVWNLLLYKYQQAIWSVAGAVFFIDIVSFLNKSDHGVVYFILLSTMNAYVLVFSYLYMAGRFKHED